MNSDVAELFRKISVGVYIVGVASPEEQHAFTASWIMPVSFNPLLLALSINPHHRSYSILKGSPQFSVSVLGEDQMDLAAHFGLSSSEKQLDPFKIENGLGGCPIFKEALAFFECQVTHDFLAGDHRLILGEVLDGRLNDPSRSPLLYQSTGDLDQASAFYPKDFRTSAEEQR
jgi:flavin reductase (DIM6/NTAB) family NADH-FMN oxidoreductase RutF